MDNWAPQLSRLLEAGQKPVVVTVASVKGSTPREAGARMLVTADEVIYTIGGGHLELKAIQIARNMMASHVCNELQRFSLGAGLGQCCGGVATLFFERVTRDALWIDALVDRRADEHFVQVIPASGKNAMPRLLVSEKSVQAYPDNFPIDRQLITMARSMIVDGAGTCINNIQDSAGQMQSFVFDPVRKCDFNIYLFGAGHVGRALVKQLAELPCRVTWVDTRDDQLPEVTTDNIVTHCTDLPEADIDEAPAGAFFLVMTHDHGLDERLSAQILKRDDFSYFGLIGSSTKRQRFEHRLSRRGVNAQQLSRMTCPIGIAGIHSKSPASIALAVAAELQQCYERLSRPSCSALNSSTGSGYLS